MSFRRPLSVCGYEIHKSIRNSLRHYCISQLEVKEAFCTTILPNTLNISNKVSTYSKRAAVQYTSPIPLAFAFSGKRKGKKCMILRVILRRLPIYHGEQGQVLTFNNPGDSLSVERDISFDLN